MSTDPLSAPTGPHDKRCRRVARALNWRGSRELAFWIMLLGSWQFLAARGSRNTFIGCIGTAVFLIMAWRNLDRLRELGLDHARWRSVRPAIWFLAAATGFIAGGIVFGLVSLSGQDMKLSDDGKLILLQVTLGPVLEEILFRGYLFALLLWVLGRIQKTEWNALVVPIAALMFAVVHLSGPGWSWLQVACITSTGVLYGALRFVSGSVAPAAVAHAAYNLTLYAVSTASKLLGDFLQ